MGATVRWTVALGWLAASCTGAISGAGEDPESPAEPGEAPSPGGAGASSPGSAAAPTPTAPAATPAAPAACRPETTTPSRPRLWRLDDAQYGKTVATLFKGRSKATNDDLTPPTGLDLPLATTATGDVKFSTSSGDRRVAAGDAEDVAGAAYDVAERLLADPLVSPCVTGTGPLRDCLERPLLQKAELLFRRPVAAADVAHYLAAAAAAEPAGRRDAIRLAFQALLVSPRLVFRGELGTTQAGRRRLDGYEVAEALSYSLTDGPPDQALWTDAQSGALHDKATIGQHVSRLLAAAEKKGPARKLVRELFAYQTTLGVKKAGTFHRPDALVKEADLFVNEVLRTSAHQGFFKELLTGRNAFVSPATAQSYNAALTGTSTTAQALAFTGDRQGLLGHPAWLSSYSTPERNDPVIRGRFVFERLLCGAVPDAPIENLPEIPEDPKRTLREKLAIHTQNPTCRVCHRLMDDIGLSLEGFDHYGRMRDTEAGRPVSREGFLRESGDQDGPFEGLGGLLTKLLASQRVADCLTAQSFEFFMGRAPGSGDACTLLDARGRYQASGGDLAAMVQGFFTSDAFLERAP